MPEKKMTETLVNSCIERFNDAPVGTTIEISLTEFPTAKLIFKREVDSTKLKYKRQTIVHIKHGINPLTVEIDSQPYMGVVSHIMPLIVRMLLTIKVHQTGKIFIP